MTQQALANALGTLPSRLVALVDELESKGLLERRPSDNDRRSYALHLTQAGQSTLQAVGRVARDHQQALLAGLSAGADRRASTSRAEETDEGADRDDDALGTLDTVRARSIQDEGSQSFGGVGACVITKGIEEPHKDSLIYVECRLRQSTVGMHPRTEFSQNGPLIGSGWPGYRRRKLALQLEESDE